MFRRTYISEALPYQKPEDRYGIPDGVARNALYNAYLITPPRIYAEELSLIDGMFVTRNGTATSPSSIVVLGWTNSIYWPSWERWFWRFDGATGEFIERGPNPASYVDKKVFQSRDGSIWQVKIDRFYEKNNLTLEAIDGTERNSDEFEDADQVLIPIVDREQNLMIAYTASDTSRTISVYNWTTGALVRRIPVSGKAENIMPEDDHRCWVVTQQGMLNLVDYKRGIVLSTLRTPLPLGGDVWYSWDFYRRRMLAFSLSPNESDGAGTSVITGYYPVPLPVALTAPIPVRPLRNGHPARVVVRTYGDAGEGLNGGTPVATVTGDGELVSRPTSPDAYGYTTFDVVGTDGGGSVDIDIALDI